MPQSGTLMGLSKICKRNFTVTAYALRRQEMILPSQCRATCKIPSQQFYTLTAALLCRFRQVFRYPLYYMSRQWFVIWTGRWEIGRLWDAEAVCFI